MQILIPEAAPFTDEQRAWLNGFVAGLLGAERALASADRFLIARSIKALHRDVVPVQ